MKQWWETSVNISLRISNNNKTYGKRPTFSATELVPETWVGNIPRN